MSPPEVAFHRYFQTLTNLSDREQYRGKQDLDQLDPSLAWLLSKVQASFNDALKNRGNVFGRGNTSEFHVDYVTATVQGALSFEFEEYAFVGITMPLIIALWQGSEALSRSVTTMDLLRTASKEVAQNDALAIFFLTQLSFLVAHEFAHHDRGHLSTRAQANALWNDMEPRYQTGSLQCQAQEMEADRWAVFLQLTHSILGGGRLVAVEALQLKSEPESSADEILLSLFIISVCALLLLWPPAFFDEVTIYNLTHPPQAARINAIMGNVKEWCEHKRPSLATWLTLQRFQAMLYSTEVVMAEINGGINWQEQTNFFHSQPGIRYIGLLEEHLRQIVQG